MPRQAGAEIEITPAMIEAGVAELEECFQFEDFNVRGVFEGLARSIYEQMVAVRDGDSRDDSPRASQIDPTHAQSS